MLSWFLDNRGLLPQVSQPKDRGPRLFVSRHFLWARAPKKCLVARARSMWEVGRNGVKPVAVPAPRGVEHLGGPIACAPRGAPCARDEEIGLWPNQASRAARAARPSAEASCPPGHHDAGPSRHQRPDSPRSPLQAARAVRLAVQSGVLDAVSAVASRGWIDHPMPPTHPVWCVEREGQVHPRSPTHPACCVEGQGRFIPPANATSPPLLPTTGP